MPGDDSSPHAARRILRASGQRGQNVGHAVRCVCCSSFGYCPFETVPQVPSSLYCLKSDNVRCCTVSLFSQARLDMWPVPGVNVTFMRRRVTPSAQWPRGICFATLADSRGAFFLPVLRSRCQLLVVNSQSRNLFRRRTPERRWRKGISSRESRKLVTAPAGEKTLLEFGLSVTQKACREEITLP